MVNYSSMDILAFFKEMLSNCLGFVQDKDKSQPTTPVPSQSSKMSQTNVKFSIRNQQLAIRNPQ
jgi:hypothetical protein